MSCDELRFLLRDEDDDEEDEEEEKEEYYRERIRKTE